MMNITNGVVKVGLMLGVVFSAAHAATRAATSCSTSDVQTAINSSVSGDTVTVPVGSCSWSGGISFTGIRLIGAGNTTSGTVITAGRVTMTKHATQYTQLSGFRFSGTDEHIYVGGPASAKPYIIDNNYIRSDVSGRALHLSANGGLLHHNQFTAVNWTNADVVNTQTSEDWSQAPTFGTADTTGERNIYFEDNTLTNVVETMPDGDVGSRIVIRRNTYVDSSIVWHGGSPNDSSPGGGIRQFEIYNNTFSRLSNSIPINKWIWVRGGTGVIANNSFARADSPDGSTYPNKPEILLTVGCPNPYPMQYQVGQSNQTPENPPTRPLVVFGNTGAGTTDSNFISVQGSGTAGPSCATPQAYIKSGRDYVLSNTWGWTPYPYPHPLVSGAVPPPTDTTAPSAPTNFSTTAVSSSQINLSWTASTDSVGVAGYRVERCQGSSCSNFAQIATPSGTTYSDVALGANAAYRYRVGSTDAAGNWSAYSSIAGTTTQSAPTDTTAPSIPTGLSGAAVSSSQINLSWTGSTDNLGVTGYRVERCQGSSCSNYAQIAAPSGASYSDIGLTAATVYRYRVGATDAAGNLSGYSSIASATTLSGSSGPSPLPSGSTGIAALYPNDTNIQTDPNVLFSDDFESYTLPGQLTTKWNSYYQAGNTRIATDSASVYSGAKSLEFTLPASTSEVANSVIKNISPTQDTLFVRVYTKFDSGYDITTNSNHNGIRISSQYPGPGTPPNGTDFFLFMVENAKFYNETNPGYSHLYVYHPEQRSQWGDVWYPDGKVIPFDLTPGAFGPYFVPRPNHIPQRDRWYCYELMVKANTPGQRDGRAAFWIDGVLIADFQNVRVRDVSTLKIDQIQLELHAQAGGSSRPNKKWYDNVVVARSYIGPMSSGAPPAPPAPATNLTAIVQ